MHWMHFTTLSALHKLAVSMTFSPGHIFESDIGIQRTEAFDHYICCEAK